MPEHLNVNQLVSLTGSTSRTIKSRLRAGMVQPIGSKGNAILYDSTEALKAIYGRAEDDDATRLTRARAELAESQKEKIDFEMAIKRGDYGLNAKNVKLGAEIGELVQTTLIGVGNIHAPNLAIITEPAEVAVYLDREMRSLISNVMEKIKKIGAADGQ